MFFKLVLLPPQSDTTKAWATRLQKALPEPYLVVAEDAAQVEQEIRDADAAYGTMPDGALERAQ